MAASVAAWSWVLKDWTDQVRASFTSVFVCTASFDADPPKATWESCLHGQRNSTRRSSAAFPEQFTLLLLDILARLWTLKSADWQILHQEMYGQSRSHNHNLLRNLGTWPTRAWRTGFRREIRETCLHPLKSQTCNMLIQCPFSIAQDFRRDGPPKQYFWWTGTAFRPRPAEEILGCRPPESQGSADGEWFLAQSRFLGAHLLTDLPRFDRSRDCL